MKDPAYDVIVIGRGPVGLSMAMSAAQFGLRVAIVEKHRDLYGLPRAGHLDHEIVRLLQSYGVAEEMLEDCYPTTDYRWVNAKGETLMNFDWGEKSVSGYNSDYMQFQPVFENALSARLSAHPLVKEYLGWEAQSLVQDAVGVTIQIAKTQLVEGIPVPQATDETETLRGAYLVAADGARSKIREYLEIGREDLGFNEKWLVVDARKKRDVTLEFDCGQICDPKRPITILPLGKRHRRFEWSIMPGDDLKRMEQPEAAWELLAPLGLGPDDLHIVRQLVYTFESRLAHRWSEGRIFLSGDAAHTMPPFMGQGMCSGMRDSHNLAWKLAMVQRGLAAPDLLHSYETERAPHTRDWTLISLESGKVPCTLDPVEAEARDARFRAGWMPPMPVFPQLRHGVLARGADGAPGKLAGTLSLQGRVEYKGRVALADDFFGTDGFRVISFGHHASKALTPEARATLERIGARFVSVGDHDGADARDVDGTYASYFAAHGITAMLVRPDFYVFGVADTVADLTGLVAELAQALHLLPETVDA